MKRATLPGIFCLLFAAQTLAGEAFLLQIPKRGIANQEIGEVRLTLGLDLPASGAQLVVDGNTTLNLGDTATVAGDEVTFAEAGANSVRITYRPLSNFGADFCAGGNAAEKNIRMTFSGAQDVVDYRVSTYVVAAPQFACAKVSKRVGELPANVIPEPDGATPLLEAIFRGRHELDVVLVLDRSGSMGEKPPGATAGPSKAELLRSTLGTFVAQWAELDAPFEGAGEWPNDRIGIVFFHDDAAMQAIAGGDPPAGQMVRRGSSLPHPWDAVRAKIQTLSPGASTAIGKGMNTATSAWLADPKNDLALVVVTDGMQNEDPLIKTNASGLLELPPPAGVATTLAGRFIPTQTIGFGTPAAVDEALLKAISEQTAGVSFIAIDEETIADSFAFTLVALLKGNTASLAARAREITSGEHQVVVDRSAQRVVFSLQWAPPDVNALGLEVFRPGGIDHAIPDSTTITPQSVLHSFVTKPGDVGTWRAKIQPNGTPTHAIPYTLNAFFNERHLDHSVAFTTTTRTRTGDPIGLRALVAYDGKPLKGLPPGAIRMRVRRPAESLGTILHLASSAFPAIAGSDPHAPYEAKVAGVVDASVLQRIKPTVDVAAIPFTEQQSGIYTATFSDTSVAGAYAFEVVLDWDDPRTGRVHREERLERHVAVKVDRGMTEVIRRDNRVVVIPRDRFGNYVGPGFATGFNVSADDPQQTGTYDVTVADGQPIVFDGVTLDAPSTPSTPSSWRIFLDAGPNFPDWSVNAGLERILSSDWSVEGIIGRHRRQSDDFNQFSLGAKRWFGPAFVNFGAGVYDSEAGAHAGVGALFGWFEVVGNLHATDGDTFATLQAGVRIGF